MNLNYPKFRMRWFITPTGAAITGLVVLGIGAVSTPDMFFRAYLFGWLCILGITMGAQGFMFIQHMTGGAWGYTVRRVAEAAGMTLPLIAVLGIPLIIGAPRLFPWANHEMLEHVALLKHREAFFNGPFILGRTIVFFALWIIIAWALRSMSLKHDKTGDPKLTARMEALSVIGMLVYFFTMSITAYDLICSREIEWYSSTFGAVTILGQACSGLCVMIIALSQLRRQPQVAALITPDRNHDLGNLLLASTVLWSYVSFAQYLIIWIGNTQEDVTWFYHRTKTVWGIVGVIIMLCHFGFPFLILMWQRVKRDLSKLAPIALWVLVMRLLDVLWMVAPTNYPAPEHVDAKIAGMPNWLDPFALLGLGGLWAVVFIWILSRQPLVPRAYHTDYEVLLNQDHGHEKHHGEDTAVGTPA